MNEKLLSKSEIRKLVREYGYKVDCGRSIKEIIDSGDIPRLRGCKVQIGKVSDSVYGPKLRTKDGKPIRLMFRSNRISTHDVNRGSIPFKDQVLGINHDFMLNLIRDTVGTAQFSIPNIKSTSTVIASENVKVFKFENVLRMFMAKSSTSTSLYQNYIGGSREFCGHKLPNNIEVNGKLPYIMDTPSTKEKNDRSVSPVFLFLNKVCSKEQYIKIRNNSIMAFGIVSKYLEGKNLILVDTKTEHGINSNGDIVSCDELYTLDSSRFWMSDKEDNIILDEDGNPKSFSKEFARKIVKDERTHKFTDKEKIDIAIRYIEGIQFITGKRFEPDLRSRDKRIIETTNKILDYLL